VQSATNIYRNHESENNSVFFPHIILNKTTFLMTSLWNTQRGHKNTCMSQSSGPQIRDPSNPEILSLRQYLGQYRNFGIIKLHLFNFCYTSFKSILCIYSLVHHSSPIVVGNLVSSLTSKFCSVPTLECDLLCESCKDCLDFIIFDSIADCTKPWILVFAVIWFVVRSSSEDPNSQIYPRITVCFRTYLLVKHMPSLKHFAWVACISR